MVDSVAALWVPTVLIAPIVWARGRSRPSAPVVHVVRGVGEYA